MLSWSTRVVCRVADSCSPFARPAVCSCAVREPLVSLPDILADVGPDWVNLYIIALYRIGILFLWNGSLILLRGTVWRELFYQLNNLHYWYIKDLLDWLFSAIATVFYKPFLSWSLSQKILLITSLPLLVTRSSFWQQQHPGGMHCWAIRLKAFTKP